MNASRRPRNAHGFRPLAILLVAAVSGVISAPSASLAAPIADLSVNDVTITEGNAGTLTAMFTVTRSVTGQVIRPILDRAGHGLEPSRLPGEDRHAEVRWRA